MDRREELFDLAQEIKDYLGCELFLEELLKGLDVDELEYQLKEIVKYYELDVENE